ncbi:hypothetical protein BH10PSE7_BH10PSE7_01760 [soil metagenome]
MTVSFYSLLGALAFLALGLVNLALFNRLFYARLSRAHEAAKATGRHRLSPARFMKWLFVADLIVLPILGFLLGDALFN